MALRAHSRTATATSGPGRGPDSDGRTRHRRPASRRGPRHREAPAEDLRRRAQSLFGEHTPRLGESDHTGRFEEQNSVLRDASPTGALDANPTIPRTATPTIPRTASPTAVRHAAATALPDPKGATSLTDEAPAAVSEAGAVAGAERDAGGTVAGVGQDWRDRARLALRERMPMWVQTRCGLERRSVIALTVVFAVAAVFALQHFWTGRTEEVRAPAVVRAVAPAQSGGENKDTAFGTPAPSPGAVATASAAPEIVVDVSGKVRHPGIHRLPAGSRVADALRAAGGVRPGTDLGGLNRARFLVDGEQVVVGGPAPATGPAAGGTAAGGAGGAGAAGAAAPPVSLSTATAEQLETLPGVGPVLAQHIIDYRTQHGGFRSVDELRQVSGIGDRRFADLRSLVRS
ncbi:helix-hairpin-helix domain-containing protein [Streptomyces carpinensis]|uniref:Helix-hairpin-helix domain-containing protein n=1 Tax=Streptomyces carpinensis TaxID=66369 RepID=A0ABV1WEV7_9ACTN